MSAAEAITERTPPEVEPTPAAEALAAFRREPGRLYAVLDPAQDEEVLGVLRRSGHASYSLYEGWAAVHYRTLCPYLVELRREGRLVEQLFEAGWRRAWGIFLTSDRDLPAVRRHLRRLLKVRAADGETVLCRFYDPLTMELFLTDPAREYDPWMFGETVRSYFLETHLEEARVFRRDATRAASPRWPLALTLVQSERYAERRRGFFVDQIERFVRAHYDDRTVRLPLGSSAVRDLPRPQLREMIDRGVARAEAARVDDPHDQLAFVGMMFLKAPNFDEHLVVREALAAMGDGLPMMNAILARESEQLWREVDEAYDPAAWGLGLRTWGGVQP